MFELKKLWGFFLPIGCRCTPLMVVNLPSKLSLILRDVVVGLDVDLSRVTHIGADNGTGAYFNGLVSLATSGGHKLIVTVNTNIAEIMNGGNKDAVWSAFLERSDLTDFNRINDK